MNLRKRSNFFSVGLLGAWLVAVAALALATPATGSAASKPEAWEQRQGGTLVIGSSKDMNTKHPYTRVTSVDEFIKMMMWEPVTMYDLTGKLHGILAESWEPNADASEWTFRLRRGVKFHNGTEMTSADWIWSYNYILNPANGAYANTVLSGNIAKVEAVDPVHGQIPHGRTAGALPSRAQLHPERDHRSEKLAGQQGRGDRRQSSTGNRPLPVRELDARERGWNSSGSTTTGAVRRTWKGSSSGSSRTRPPGRTRCAPAT